MIAFEWILPQGATCMWGDMTGPSNRLSRNQVITLLIWALWPVFIVSTHLLCTVNVRGGLLNAAVAVLMVLFLLGLISDLLFARFIHRRIFGRLSLSIVALLALLFVQVGLVFVIGLVIFSALYEQPRMPL